MNSFLSGNGCFERVVAVCFVGQPPTLALKWSRTAKPKSTAAPSRSKRKAGFANGEMFAKRGLSHVALPLHFARQYKFLVARQQAKASRHRPPRSSVVLPRRYPLRPVVCSQKPAFGSIIKFKISMEPTGKEAYQKASSYKDEDGKFAVPGLQAQSQVEPHSMATCGPSFSDQRPSASWGIQAGAANCARFELEGCQLSARTILHLDTCF